MKPEVQFPAPPAISTSLSAIAMGSNLQSQLTSGFQSGLWSTKFPKSEVGYDCRLEPTSAKKRFTEGAASFQHSLGDSTVPLVCLNAAVSSQHHNHCSARSNIRLWVTPLKGKVTLWSYNRVFRPTSLSTTGLWATKAMNMKQRHLNGDCGLRWYPWWFKSVETNVTVTAFH